MATTPVDTEGTQSAPSPMVAVPGAREAPVILGTGIGMSMPKMECKINLRSGNQDAWRRWTVNRNDVITRLLVPPLICGAAGNVGFHSIRRQLAAPEARGRIPIEDLSAVPADLGSSMRFRPTALLDALVDHETFLLRR